jgi:hypothetical protein
MQAADAIDALQSLTAARVSALHRAAAGSSSDRGGRKRQEGMAEELAALVRDHRVSVHCARVPSAVYSAAPGDAAAPAASAAVAAPLIKRRLSVVVAAPPSTLAAVSSSSSMAVSSRSHNASVRRVAASAVTPAAHGFGLRLAHLASYASSNISEAPSKAPATSSAGNSIDADLAQQFKVFSSFGLSTTAALRLAAALPEQLHQREPALIYQAAAHGSTLQAISNAFDAHRRACGLKSFDLALESVLLVRTRERAVIGAFCSHALRIQRKNSAFGNASCFVFRVNGSASGDGNASARGQGGAFEMWRTQPAAAAQRHPMLTMTADTLTVGGGTGNALRLNATLDEGMSSACSTFASPPLCARSARGGSGGHDDDDDDDDDAAFEILDVAVIAFK